jgi:hypothetical protein
MHMVRGSENSNTSGILQKKITAPPPHGAYLAHILKSFHTFDLKQHLKNEFHQSPRVSMKLDSVLEDYIFFENLSHVMTLGEN